MNPERPSTRSSAVELCEFFSEYSRVERYFTHQFELTPQLARTLFYIYDEKPCCVRKLTERLGIHATSTSKFLSRLEQRGLLVRSMDRIDHRIERIVLTAEGIRTIESIREQLQSMTNELDTTITSHIRTCLEPAPVAHLGQLISRILISLRSTTAHSPSHSPSTKGLL